jgi:ABC-type Na+ efflux pump permease subunit
MSELLRKVLPAIALAVIALLVALMALTIAGGTASAQYPPPAGSVTVSLSDPTPPTESSVTCTCAVLDSAGNPVAGELCVFTIVSQPGTDAYLSSTSAVTNAQGIATVSLYTGSTAGAISVSAEARSIESQATAIAESGTPVAPTAPATPGAAPPTGVGQSDGGTSLALWLVAIGAAGVLGLASLVVVLRSAAGRPRNR